MRTVKNNNRSNQQKATFTRAVHFFVYFIAFALHDYNVKLPETSWLHVLCRKRRTCSCSLFFTVAHFHPGDRQHFSFSHHCYKMSCCSSNKKCLLCFSSLSLYLFVSLSFAVLSSTFSSSLSLSVSLFSKFVDMTINPSLTLQTTRIQKQFLLSVFVFIDSLVVSASQDAGGHTIYHQNNRLTCGRFTDGRRSYATS